MAFLFFLEALFKIGVLKDSDYLSVGLTVFAKYMDLARLLQQTYTMEPAGSQGVWALDDYQFVSFVWGAAQMVGNIQVKPKSIPDYEIAEMLAPEYHLFACIKYISRVKSGPFAEHSNQLWNVSGVPRWEKVVSGLVKMYRAEVLCKFPVVQHVYFGSLFTLEESANPVPDVPSANTRGRPGGDQMTPGLGTMPPRPGGNAAVFTTPALPDGLRGAAHPPRSIGGVPRPNLTQKAQTDDAKTPPPCTVDSDSAS